MKKLTLLCVALILSLGVGEASAQQQKNASDSLAYILGATQGVGLHRDVVKAQGAAATKEYCSDFIRGIKSVVLADTVQTGYIDGIETGLVFLKELVRMQAHGKGVSHQIFVETLEKFFYDDTVNEAQFNTMLNDMRRQMEPVIEAYRARQEQTEKAAKEAVESVAKKNIEAANKFVENLKATEPNLKTTASGLMYKVIKEGNGPKLGAEQTAILNYKGTLVDGTQFDANDGVKLSPMGVIRGFGEGLQLMNKGAHYILYIPQELAYGLQGPPVIGPAQMLIFEIEITDIVSE